jgi:hypothetical protein
MTFGFRNHYILVEVMYDSQSLIFSGLKFVPHACSNYQIMRMRWWWQHVPFHKPNKENN